ncbi:MAG: hypothetical protein GY898_18185 [Proteobacteria bacterium]|nr:hypothetical protein [Pseudomonadota bacterium]
MRAERTNPGQAPKPIATPLRSRWGAALISAVAVTASLIFVAWAKMETVQITYEIDDLIDTEQELAEEQRRLRSQLAELRSPQALHQLAPELGLAAPEPGHVVVVTGDPEGLAAVLDDSAEADVDPIAPEEGPTP